MAAPDEQRHAVPLDESAPPAPIFILAPLPRSGTNFLWDILRLHDDCATGRSPIWEDYLLRNAHHLAQFVDGAQGSWDPVWGPTDHLRGDLAASLGDALVRFMTIDPDRRLLTKSPTLDNLELFFDFFPRAHLVVLLRDGRDVVDSGMATFGWELEAAARAWAKGVDRVQRFVARDDVPADQCSIVRYEDLVHRADTTIPSLLRELQLSDDGIDVAAVVDLPVRGSSQFKGETDDIHWHPVPRADGFNPTRRWQRWDAAAHRAFGGVAGAQLRRLGYDS